MTIFEYLQAKYGEDGPLVVTAIEAREFGIQYPLQTGWVEKHGAAEITKPVAKRLSEKLYQKGMRSSIQSKSNYCLTGASILRGIAK